MAMPPCTGTFAVSARVGAWFSTTPMTRASTVAPAPFGAATRKSSAVSARPSFTVSMALSG